MEHNQSTYTIATILNHQCAIQVKFHGQSCLFHQLLKKPAAVERLFWQLGTHLSGGWPLYRGGHYREV